MKFYIVIIFVNVLSIFTHAPNIGKNFKELHQHGLWYVMFYAPWCGYCKQLEPIWDNMALILHKSPINVGKVDATIYKDLASQFKINGYPTIIFFVNGQPHIYEGQRNIKDFLIFADKVKGPYVRVIDTSEKFQEMIDIHINGVFFLCITHNSSVSHIYNVEEQYKEIAINHYIKMYFYIIDYSNLPQNYQNIIIKHPQFVHENFVPSIFVFKDQRVYPYIPLSYISQNVNKKNTERFDDLYAWVRCQQFKLFIPDVDSEVIQQSNWCHKKLVIAFIKKYHKDQLDEENGNLISALNTITLEYNDLAEYFWFGSTTDSDLVSSLTSRNTKAPYLFVFNSENFTWRNFHNDIDDNNSSFSINEILTFLDEIRMNKDLIFYGGNDMKNKVYRKLFGFYNNFLNMFESQPFLSTVIFGLPTCIFLFLIYNLFCMGSIDENDSSDSKDEMPRIGSEMKEYSSDDMEEESNMSLSGGNTSDDVGSAITTSRHQPVHTLTPTPFYSSSQATTNLLPTVNNTATTLRKRQRAIRSYSEQEWTDDDSPTVENELNDPQTFFNQSFSEKSRDNRCKTRKNQNTSKKNGRRRRLILHH